MAGDKKQFKYAFAQWQTLKLEGALSYPPELGKTAIICSYHSEEVDDHAVRRGARDVKIFRKEALKLADWVIEDGHEVEVVLDAQKSDIESILKDPTISDIYTIGHGCLSSIYLSGNEPDTYDWVDVYRDSDHLKEGVFVQRHCGQTSRDLSVPLGLFAVSNAENVFAPLNEYFNPRGFYHPDNDKLVSIFPDGEVNYQGIKDLRQAKAA